MPVARRTTIFGSWLRRSLQLIACVALVAALLPTSVGRGQEVPELFINSSRYTLIDAETGEVYAQHRADEQVAIASLTKIFTAIEAIEAAPLDTMLETSSDDILDPTNNSIMGFDSGEQLSLRELLFGLMLPSGNDAALTIARNLGFEEGDDSAQESIDRFVGKMNQRALDMGLLDTVFVNPHGWGVPGHYSSASDVATFTRYAIQYPFFVELISTPTHVTAEGFTIRNNNWLLNNYDYIVGGKTGYDWDSGWCLMEVGERDGMTMISVTLDGVHENRDWYDDNRVLLEYGFEQKFARLSSTEPWDGDIAGFSDPDATMLGRTVTGSAGLGGQPDTTLLSNGEASDLRNSEGNTALGIEGDRGNDAGSDWADVSNAEERLNPTSQQSRNDSSFGSMGEQIIAGAGVLLLIVLGVIGGTVFRSQQRPVL